MKNYIDGIRCSDDETPVYDAVIAHSPDADVVIPPRANAVENDKAAMQRNRNIRLLA
jgi:hypothetical protein